MRSLKLIGIGRTADVFEYQPDKVIKLYHKGYSRNAIQREFEVSRYVNSLGITTPQSYEVVDLDNRNGIVFQQISGITLLKLMMKKPWLVNQYSRTLANLHYQIHSHTAGEELRDQKAILSDCIQDTQLLNEDEKKQILQYLDRLPTSDQVCHGDFHPDNVLIDEKEWVIDWMNGMSGNAAGDVARTFVLLSHGTLPDNTPKLIKYIINLLRNRLRNKYLNQYLRVSGLTYAEIDSWIMPVAAARLVEGIPLEEKDNLLKMVKERLKSIS